MKRIELLYPKLCNIYAETYNVEFLSKCSPEIEVIETQHGSEPLFIRETPDMIYLGSSSESKQEQIISLLMPYRDRLNELIGDGTLFLVTGNAPEIFGREIREGERVIPALGIFDLYAERYLQEERHNSQFVGSCTLEDGEKLTLLGHKSQFSFSYGAEDEAFIDIELGVGLNPGTKKEGLRRNNFIATYSLGPFLILNPLFAKYILRLLGLNDALCFEEDAVAAYEYRLQELRRVLK